MPIERIHKAFDISAKAAQLTQNCIDGWASVMGIMDRGGDCICPGFWKSVLKGFKQHGFISASHDWTDFMAMPVEAAERTVEIDGQKRAVLWSKAEFHSTQDAQDLRTKCQERMDRGLSIGLSVGFGIDYQEGRVWFQSGKDMWKHVEECADIDTALFDKKSITAYKGPCRLLLPGGCTDLFEWAITPVPMHQNALATSVKSADGDEGGEDAAPKHFGLDNSALNALEFGSHAETVLTAVRGLVARSADYKSVREEKGRSLSEQRRAELEQLRSLIDGLLATDTEAPKSLHELRARATAKLREVRTG